MQKEQAELIKEMAAEEILVKEALRNVSENTEMPQTTVEEKKEHIENISPKADDSHDVRDIIIMGLVFFYEVRQAEVFCARAVHPLVTNIAGVAFWNSWGSPCKWYYGRGCKAEGGIFSRK